jgi:4'-phosphopantetheinyl transferase
VNPAGVQVWLAPESLAEEPESAERLRALLSDTELEQQRAFRAESPRRLHLVARGLQRAVLSHLVPTLAPRDWRFERGAGGRPSIAPVHGLDLDFNIAHTPGLVVMAVGAGMRLGIDVETFAARRSVQIARRYFSVREIYGLEALPPAEQPRRFVELWTLKEAYLKAIGTGISGGLGTMTFDLRDGDITFERAADPEAARWQFHQRTVGSAHLLALAWLGPAETTRRPAFHDFAFDASPQNQDS